MKRTTRRQFIGNAAGAAIGFPFVLRTLPALAAAAGPRRDPNLTVARRRLGRTELMVSEVGFGGHYKNPDRTARIASVDRALDLGINLFDAFEAAPDYCEITMVGDALDFLGRRDEAVIATHLWTFGRYYAIDEIDRALRMLKTDHIDIGWLTALHIELHDDAVEVAMRAKEQGKVRFLGITGHEKTQVIETLKHGDVFDAMLFPYSFGFEDGTKYHFPMAKQRDMGIIGIKPFAGGALFRAERKLAELQQQSEFADIRPATAFLKYILQNQALTATIPGMTTAAQVEENAGASGASVHAEEAAFLSHAFAATKPRALKDHPFLERYLG